jgi:hypothetical protein
VRPLATTARRGVGHAQAAVLQAGQVLPAPVDARLLVDTGATGSLVREGILTTLGLHPVGTVNINTPSSKGVPCPLYSVRLTLPHRGYIDTSVIQAPPDGLAGQNIDGLIGRDVLQYGILIYLGQKQQFTLSF